jgi:hypothetical protein
LPADFSKGQSHFAILSRWWHYFSHLIENTLVLPWVRRNDFWEEAPKSGIARHLAQPLRPLRRPRTQAGLGMAMLTLLMGAFSLIVIATGFTLAWKIFRWIWS